MSRGRKIGFAESFKELQSAHDPVVELWKRGTLCVELYAPADQDLQQPHGQDELYVVQRGTGTFIVDGARHEFAAGDMLFAAAGIEHRFENFTSDLVVWVVFYGPEGGEEPA